MASSTAGGNISSIKSAANAFVSFLHEAVTPFHAVAASAALLKQAGFKELSEKEAFTVQPGDKYFIKKNQTSIAAFAVGGRYQPGNGFSIVAAHTDSPCLRVKPVSKRCNEKFVQVGVSCYGGGIWRSWFDRDLSVAGQVIFRQSDKIHHRLVDVKRPILTIPSLAIHLDPARDSFTFCKEKQLLPILATQAERCLNKCPSKEGGDVKGETPKKGVCSIVEEHHEGLLSLVAELAGCGPEEVLDVDLYLYDAQPAAITGLNEEFIAGARLDNLVGTYTDVGALIESRGDGNAFEANTHISLIACFDHEEVGSQSAVGAGSAFIVDLLRRLVATPNNDGAFERAMAHSYMISADQAHAAHPNYGSCHEDKHRPVFHGGVVVKTNVNQRYATTAITHSVLKVIAEGAGVPLQKVVVRNDTACGSTIGPILSSKLGMQTVDVGCPQLAMHSIREFADTSSIWQATTLFSAFFKHLPAVLESIRTGEQ